MLSVIIDPCDAPDALMVLLADLAEGAVEGVIRDVQILDCTDEELALSVAGLAGETGARVAADFQSAVKAARSDLLLVAPAQLRLKEDWVDDLGRHLRAGNRQGVLRGEGGGLFRRAPEGLIMLRETAEGFDKADFVKLRAKLGSGALKV